VHRDLKPHNLLVGADGRVKIADFGVARSLDGAAFTQTGSVLGTAGYLAPEQARGEPVTAAADIYGLGVTLHQLATGRMPAPGTPLELPESLRGAVARALDPDPARRPTAPELARMLAAETSPVTPARSGTATGATLVQAGAALASDATLIQAGPSPAATAPPRVHGHDRRARRRWLAALLAVLALAVVVALAAGHGGGASTPPPRHHARQRTVPAIPTGATPAAQARLLARWLRDRAG
jgi:serine/threonine protein kinase